MKRVIQQAAVKSKSPLFVLSMFVGSSVSMFAQSGAVSFTEFINFAGGVMALLLVLGAVAVVGGLIFTIGKFSGGRMGEAAMGLVGVVFGGLIIGYAKPWAQQLTGQTLP